MCGISGAVGRIDASIEAAVHRMDVSQVHRGPDGHGSWRSEQRSDGRGAMFAHRRLAIIDLSAAGHQPMMDPDTGAVITYNGELYNYRALRAELAAAGVSFSSDCDTEVVLKAFSHWGEACLDRFRGMFAFAIWEPRKRRVFLARDRLGIKPLYLAPVHDGDGLRAVLFASELRALLASGLVPRELDPAGVSSFLWNGFVTGPRTLIRGVECFPAGECTSIDLDTMVSRRRRYWGLPRFADGSGEAAELDRRIEESVGMRLVSDVPLAVFLSGGVDSSLVAALASRASDRPIRTFNVGFDEVDYDESVHARRVADAIGSDHESLVLTEDRFTSQLGDAIGALDQPTYDAVNTYFVSRVVREAGITVALAGTGGDELCGGYASFVDLPRAVAWSRRLGWMPAAMGRFAADAAARVKYGASTSIRPQTRWGKLDDLLVTRGDLVAAYQVAYAKFTRRFLAELYPEHDERATPWGLDPARFEQLEQLVSTSASMPGRISMLELSLFVGERLLRDTDTTSMSVSLEVRVPLLDHEVIAAAASLDERALYEPLRQKQVLRRLVGEYVPADVFDRPKAGFVLPIERWSRAGLGNAMNDTLNDHQLSRDVGLDPAAVSRLWAAHRDGAAGLHYSRVWGMFVLLDWCRRHEVRA